MRLRGVTKTWSWSVSMNNDCMSHKQLVTSRGFTITYNNQCGRSISGSVSGIGYTQNGEEQVNSASFTIPIGSRPRVEVYILAEKWYVEM